MPRRQGQDGATSGRRKPGPKSRAPERRSQMLDQATVHAGGVALGVLRLMFSVNDIAKTLKLVKKTVKKDWNTDGGSDPTDGFIVALARDRLYDIGTDRIKDGWSAVIQGWPQQLGSPEEKFVAVIADICDEMLKRPETDLRLLVPLLVASARRCHSTFEIERDAALTAHLIDLRKTFDDYVIKLWQTPLQIALAEMGRRPRDGTDIRRIAAAIHTWIEGHILRYLGRGDDRSDVDVTSIGRDTLMLLEGFTRPDVPDREPDGDIEAWIRDRAAHVALELYRAVRPNDDEAPSDPVDGPGEILDLIANESRKIDRAELKAAFDREFPDMRRLRDAALRRRLQRGIDATMEMYSSRLGAMVPGTFLRQAISLVGNARSTDQLLAQLCRQDRDTLPGSYLAEVERLVANLLRVLGTLNPDEEAKVLIDRTLNGDRRDVEVMLGMATRESEARESALLREAAAAEQVGEELGEVGT